MALRSVTVGAPAGRARRLAALALSVPVVAASGCSLVATPTPPSLHDASLAPSGAMGYVVCPTAVTPLELTTGTPEADIPLPLPRPPTLGNFAIAASPDGRAAYVVATIGGAGPASPATSSVASAPVSASATGAAGDSEVIPIDLVDQRAGRPIELPGFGSTHAAAVLAGGRTVLVADGSAVVPVDTVTRRVGTPIQLGPGHTVYGLALAPGGDSVYALVPGGVYALHTATGAVGPEIPTGLAISSVYSPHGITVTADGGTVYVVGQGGTDFGGRVLPIVAATGATLAPAGFDQYGIADPAALAVSADGSSLLVVDSANNWINPVDRSSFTNPPPPVRLPDRTGSSAAGTGHPTDIVVGPGGRAFVVDGFASVIPYQPASGVFGRPVSVCSGATSMAVAPAP